MPICHNWLFKAHTQYRRERRPTPWMLPAKNGR